MSAITGMIRKLVKTAKTQFSASGVPRTRSSRDRLADLKLQIKVSPRPLPRRKATPATIPFRKARSFR